MADFTASRLLVAVIIFMAPAAFLRLLYIHPSILRPQTHPRLKYPRTCPAHMIIVLGSGGHTAEMLSLLRDLDPKKYTRRTYIVSSGDTFSSSKALEFEKRIQSKYTQSPMLSFQARGNEFIGGTFDIRTVPRARRIHQPLCTAPLSSFQCLIGCIRALYLTSRVNTVTTPEYADVIISNGPATGVIVILASMLLKFFALAPVWKMKTVYVESWARVTTLSLSGKILLWLGLCDRFLVQWEELCKAINGNDGRQRVEWKGFLVD